MKKLMFAAFAGIAVAASAAMTSYEVYTFQQNGKVFNKDTGKTVAQKLNGLAVYDANMQQVYACTWGAKKDTTFDQGNKVGKKAYTGKQEKNMEFFLDLQEKGNKKAFGYVYDANKGYGTGGAKSVKGNFVGEKVYGTWQLKFDATATKKFTDINSLLESKNVEVRQ